MRRSVVFSVAGAALGLAVVLTLARSGGRPGRRSRTARRSSSGSFRASTELLPISSSGHLILVPWAAEWTYLEENDRFNQTFDVALHLGTLVAVGAYFWSDIVRLVRAWLGSLGRRRIEYARRADRVVRPRRHDPRRSRRPPRRGRDRRQPRRAVADPRSSSPQARCSCCGPTARRRPKRWATSGCGTRVVMGFAQALALAPGVSRSGITITAGRFMKLDRDSAARFSFLLLLPDRARRGRC